MEAAYRHGYNKAAQDCLNIVNRAADYVQNHPSHPLDIYDIFARLITDIQVVKPR